MTAFLLVGLAIAQLYEARQQRLAAQAANSDAQLARKKAEAAADALEALTAEAERDRTRIADALRQTTELQQRLVDLSRRIPGVGDLIKGAFTSQRTEYFRDQHTPPARMQILARKRDSDVAVLLLLDGRPIPKSVELQYGTAVQPKHSFLVCNNLIVFLWSDNAQLLRNGDLSVTYTADSTSSRTIKALRRKDGRVYADEQPFPLYGDVVDEDVREKVLVQTS
jgi:hypothetical protein